MDYNFHLGVGPSFKFDNYLEYFGNSKGNFYYNIDMYEIINKCDAAISACGSTLYELEACGINDC